MTGMEHMDSFIQFITVLFIFLFVLVITYFVTKWIAKYQKTQTNGNNIEIIETQRITTSKFIQLIRVGGKYFAIVVCKDTVTMISEISKEDIIFINHEDMDNINFIKIFEKVKNRVITDNDKKDQTK